MDSEFTIRKAYEDDLDAIVNLWIEFIDFHKELDFYFARSNKGHEEFKKIIAARIKDDKAYILVAERKGEIIGFSTAMITTNSPISLGDEYGVIMSFAITEKYRRQGVGDQMLKKVVIWFREQGIHRIEIRASVLNKISLSFWKKHNFTTFIERMYLKI